MNNAPAATAGGRSESEAITSSIRRAILHLPKLSILGYP